MGQQRDVRGKDHSRVSQGVFSPVSTRRAASTNPDFSPKFVSQVSCRAELVFGFVLSRTGLPSARRLPFKAPNCLALALIPRRDAFSGRLARRAPCAAWNQGRKSSTRSEE